MDLCVFDWKALSPIIGACIASGTALWISNKWNRQKGEEVVANEAKLLISDIDSFTENLNELGKLNLKITRDVMVEKTTSLGELSDKINNRLDFLLMSISDESLLKELKLFRGAINDLITELKKLLVGGDSLLNTHWYMIRVISHPKSKQRVAFNISIKNILIPCRKIALYNFKLK